jgi:hypothetical protein
MVRVVFPKFENVLIFIIVYVPFSPTIVTFKMRPNLHGKYSHYKEETSLLQFFFPYLVEKNSVSVG